MIEHIGRLHCAAWDPKNLALTNFEQKTLHFFANNKSEGRFGTDKRTLFENSFQSRTGNNKTPPQPKKSEWKNENLISWFLASELGTLTYRFRIKTKTRFKCMTKATSFSTQNKLDCFLWENYIQNWTAKTLSHLTLGLMNRFNLCIESVTTFLWEKSGGNTWADCNKENRGNLENYPFLFKKNWVSKTSKNKSTLLKCSFGASIA